MPYTDATAVRDVLAPDGDRSAGTAASLSDSELTDAVSAAQLEVDSRLRGRYTVPWADGQVPQLVQLLTRDIAAYNATLTYYRNQPLNPTDPVVLRYKGAELLLGQLQTGSASLGQDAVPLVGGGHASVANPYDGDLWTMAGMGIGPPRTWDVSEFPFGFPGPGQSGPLP